MKKWNIALYFLLATSVAVAQQTVSLPDSLLYRQVDLDMLELQSMPWTQGCDSIYNTHRGKYFYYNSDSLFHLIATRPIEKIYEEVWYYYDVLPQPYFSNNRLDISRWQTEREKLAQAAKRYKSKALEQELDVFDSKYKYVDRIPNPDIWDSYWRLVEKYERKKEHPAKLRILHSMLLHCSGFWTGELSERIEKEHVPVIQVINEILSTLERLDGRYEIGYGLYVHIGLIYYNFGLYDKAIPLFWKYMDKPHCCYYDRAYMRARDYLGAYYRMQGDYDRSDSLYLSILLSADSVFQRPVDETVAIGSLARNAMLRGEHDEAMRLFSVALPRALQVRDTTLAGGYAIQLGRLYLLNNEPHQTREALDIAHNYLIAGGDRIRNWNAYYTLERDYYLKTNQADKAAVCIDSIASIQASEAESHNTRLLAYAEQEAYELEKALRDEHIRRQNNRLIFISIVLALALVTLGILVYFYRMKQEKNRALYRQIKEQDRLADELEALKKQQEQWMSAAQKDVPEDVGKTSANQPEMKQKGTLQQRKLVDRLREYLLTDKNFANPETGHDRFVMALTTNKTYLFDAVKAVTGLSLQDYINSFRLEEARRLFDSQSNFKIEVIADECGFNTYRTFQRAFRERYKMNPTDYRKMSLSGN